VKIIPILILSIFLVACACTKTPDIPGITPKVVNIDTTALEQCPTLNEDIQVSTFDQFILVYGDLATQYGKCANKQASSVKLLKQFGNIK
jgi:hypothetical protein